MGTNDFWVTIRKRNILNDIDIQFQVARYTYQYSFGLGEKVIVNGDEDVYHAVMENISTIPNVLHIINGEDERHTFTHDASTKESYRYLTYYIDGVKHRTKIYDFSALDPTNHKFDSKVPYLKKLLEERATVNRKIKELFDKKEVQKTNDTDTKYGNA